VLKKALVGLVAFGFVSCGGGGDDGPGGTGLSAADFESVAPCPNQELLRDPALLAAVQAAMLANVTYDDIPFDAMDPDIFAKKCGLEGAWDPALATDLIAENGPPRTLANMFITGNAGICSDNFANFGTDEGFPKAGTYRKQFRVNNAGVSTWVRARAKVSGSAAGARFADEGVVIGDLSTTFEYAVNGTVVAHDALWAGIVNALTTAGDLPVVTLEVRRMAGGDVILTVEVTLICAVAIQ
jgi:hypothetical protein